jgi:rRNA-processing protein FCF1
MAFFQQGDDGTDFISRVTERGGNIFGGIAKGAVDQATKRADGARENALAAVALAGVNSIVDSFLGTDEQIVPPQYNGNSSTLRDQKKFLDSYSYGNDEFFNTVVQDAQFKYNTSHPMTKSLFLVEFEFNNSIAPNSKRLNSKYPRSTSYLLKNMTFPSAEIELEKVNQYNHHRNVPRRIMYTPITCRFGDIYRNYKEDDDKISIMDLYKEYMSYYYNDFEVSETGYHFGHNSDRDDKQFINSISIYFFWADGAKKIRVVNPMIKSFVYDELSYDSDEQLTASCNIEYEYIDMTNINMTYDDFLDQASIVLNNLSRGLQDTNVSNPYANADELQPGAIPVDLGRDVALDNAAAQTMIRLAEIEAIELAEGSLNSDNALERAVAEEGVNVATGATGGVGGFLGGLF